MSEVQPHTKLPLWLDGRFLLGEDDKPGDTLVDDPTATDPPAGDEGLKSALAKERQGHKAESQRAKALEAELKQLREAEEARQLSEKSEVEQLTAKLQKAEEKLAEKDAQLQGIAKAYAKSQVTDSIKELAKKHSMKDPSDAVALIGIDAIDYTQDETDLAKVEVNQTTVEKAVKELVEKKPHLVGTNEETTPSGSTFGGGRASKGNLDEAGLKELYPGL